MNVRQSEVTASELVCELQMIESQQVQHGGVQVVQVDFVLDGEVTIFVSGSVAYTMFRSLPKPRIPYLL